MFQVSEAETIITKRSILDVAAALDPPLRTISSYQRDSFF